MVYLSAVEAARVARVKGVALREEVLERTGLRLEEHAALRPVDRLEHEWPGGIAAGAHELDPLTAAGHRGTRMEVRQPVGAPCCLDREPARRVEAEEPDSGLALGGDVRADVQLRKARDDRHRQRPAQAEAADQERRDAEPGAAVVLLELELVRHELPQRRRIDAP